VPRYAARGQPLGTGPLDISLTDESRRAGSSALHAATPGGAVRSRQDDGPGALITGKWKDIGKFRARSCAHSPHARPLPQWIRSGPHAVVDFYDQRFSLSLTQDEKDDLVAFLRTL
jgi:cytosine/adenosine deaminase-related metal-dependent hydrolase